MKKLDYGAMIDDHNGETVSILELERCHETLIINVKYNKVLFP